MAKEIEVLIVEPGKAPRLAKVNNTWAAFQHIVGGPIDTGCYLPQRVMLISNAEGKKIGLSPNRAVRPDGEYIAGTFLLCSFEDNSYTSLSAEQQAEFSRYFSQPGEWALPLSAEKVSG